MEKKVLLLIVSVSTFIVGGAVNDPVPVPVSDYFGNALQTNTKYFAITAHQHAPGGVSLLQGTDGLPNPAYIYQTASQWHGTVLFEIPAPPKYRFHKDEVYENTRIKIFFPISTGVFYTWRAVELDGALYLMAGTYVWNETETEFKIVYHSSDHRGRRTYRIVCSSNNPAIGDYFSIMTVAHGGINYLQLVLNFAAPFQFVPA